MISLQIVLQFHQSQLRAPMLKTRFMLNSTEFEISTAHKKTKIKNKDFAFKK